MSCIYNKTKLNNIMNGFNNNIDVKPETEITRDILTMSMQKNVITFNTKYSHINGLIKREYQKKEVLTFQTYDDAKEYWKYITSLY